MRTRVADFIVLLPSLRVGQNLVRLLDRLEGLLGLLRGVRILLHLSMHCQLYQSRIHSLPGELCPGTRCSDTEYARHYCCTRQARHAQAQRYE